MLQEVSKMPSNKTGNLKLKLQFFLQMLPAMESNIMGKKGILSHWVTLKAVRLKIRLRNSLPRRSTSTQLR
jgi:hypothetical protein